MWFNEKALEKEMCKYINTTDREELEKDLEDAGVIHLLDEKEEQPYIEGFEVRKVKLYNPDYGDDKECECGHPYYRHFDSYEGMEPVGCKYCGCREFREPKGD